MASISRFTLLAFSLIALTWTFEASAKSPQICYCPCPTAPVINLKDPKIDPIRLLNWVSDAAVLSFHYDYNGIEQWMRQYSPYFDTRGWFHYYQALKNSGNLEKVAQDHINVSSVPLAPAVVLWEGVDLDVYKWRVQIPLLVQYQFASGKIIQQKMMVNMSLRRIPDSLGKGGIGIERFIAKPT